MPIRATTSSLAAPRSRYDHISPPPRRRSTVPEEPFLNPPPAMPMAKSVGEPPPTPDYDVGYKRPPRHSQFKPGQSGNRKGRPRGAKGLKTLVRELLTQKVAVRTASGVKRMTKMEAMLQKILEQAFSGNLRALQSFVALYQAAVPDDPPENRGIHASTLEPAEINEHDRAMLDELRATLTAELGDTK